MTDERFCRCRAATWAPAAAMEWQRAIHLCQVQVRFSITFCSTCFSEPLHISVCGSCPAIPPLASSSSPLQYSYGPQATLLRMRNHLTTSSLSMCALRRSPFQMTTSDDSTASTGGNATAHNKTAEVPVMPVTSSTEELRHTERLEKTGPASAPTQAPSPAPAAAPGPQSAAGRKLLSASHHPASQVRFSRHVTPER